MNKIKIINEFSYEKQTYFENVQLFLQFPQNSIKKKSIVKEDYLL